MWAQILIWSALRRIYYNRLGFFLWKRLLPHVFLHKIGEIWYLDEETGVWEWDIGFNMIRATNHWIPLVYKKDYFHERT